MSRAAHVALMALAVTGCKTTAERVLALEGDRIQGEIHYQQNCESCHGVEGLGVTGPALTERLPLLTDEEILTTIEEGPGDMPEFLDQFTDQELADLLLFLKSEFQ